MTFLELQKMIIQTRKARKGIANRHEYFEEGSTDEEFWQAVYKRALSTANAVIKHYEESGKFDPKDKSKLIWK